MRQTHRRSLIFTGLMGVLIMAVVLAASVGAAAIAPGDVLRVIASYLPWLGDRVDVSSVSLAHESILLHIRLPRIALAFLVGGSLSVAGSAMQGMLKNPMADPFIMGTSSGAALGAAVAIVLRLNQSLLGFGAVSMMAFAGALLATSIVYRLARVGGRVPVTALLLAGIATGQFFTAILSFLMVMASRDVNSIVYWTLGSLSSRGWQHVGLVVLPALFGTAVLMFYSRDLNLLLLGEDTAANTGVPVERVKRVLLITSTLMTAFMVSVSGIIGFVGLIVPHATRFFTGPDHRFLIPASGLAGGIFLIVADTLSRTVIAPTELPVGILTAMAGAPFFIYLLRRSKKIS
ncbi:FecCD family ABC transporter permease [Anoxynatronum sibiricum]|uniref:Iron chelate uptake ABC transporter family permease subunit n=1 Tax=Anoxynatronum sibiricum TaxID=210623 RepID=A0ABU9VRN0_9CLOT